MSSTNGSTQEVHEILPPHTGRAFAAMKALRTDLVDEEAFAREVEEVLCPEGYRLVGVFEEGQRQALAVAGFRSAHNLAWGHHLYVDDLATSPQARRRGCGGRLLDWLVEEARRTGCGQLHLDSGVGLERADAHRLYVNAGFVISSHHFARLIPE